jgi:hypothetical protein
MLSDCALPSRILSNSLASNLRRLLQEAQVENVDGIYGYGVVGAVNRSCASGTSSTNGSNTVAGFRRDGRGSRHFQQLVATTSAPAHANSVAIVASRSEN